MQLFIILPAFCVTIVLVQGDPLKECRKTSKFYTKTGYNQLPKVTAKLVKPINYTAIQINMVHRHGERFPSSKDVRKMNDFSKKINGIKNLSKLVNLTLPWYTKFVEIEHKMLSKEGETVLYRLGKRIRNRFPEVFTKTYTPYNYKFVSTSKTRTTGSAVSIGLGLYEGYGHLGPSKEQPIHLQVTPCDKDIILKAVDNCPRYKIEVDDNDDATKEVKMFEKGKEMQNVIDNMKFKFGDVNMELSFDDVKIMYKICAWDIIMFNGSRNKGMCSMFSED